MDDNLLQGSTPLPCNLGGEFFGDDGFGSGEGCRAADAADLDGARTGAVAELEAGDGKECFADDGFDLGFTEADDEPAMSLASTA